MFFKRARNDAAEQQARRGNQLVAQADAAPPGPFGADSSPLVAAEPHKALVAGELRRRVDAANLGFRSTGELKPATGLIGQDRALKAIAFGASMKAHDFNVFVLGPPASGKSTAVKSYLAGKVISGARVFDWAYVNNFEDASKPRVLRLTCGRGKELAKAMIAAIDELRATVPAAFEGEDYQVRRRGVEEAFRAGSEEAFEALNKEANAQNIAILRTPSGFVMAPTHDGKVVKPELFNTLPEDMRREIEAKIEALQAKLEAILERMPRLDKERRAHTAQLNEEIAQIAVKGALDDVRMLFPDMPEVLAHLDAAERDLIHNIAIFLTPGEQENQIVRQSVDIFRDPRFRRYMVNVIVENGEPETCTTPIVEELNPTYGYLVGRVEHLAQMGALVTDFLLIRPGALHRANGGYLLIDARRLLLSPFAWEALKRTIKSREIRIEQPAETQGLISTQMLEPEAIPLDVKVILFGDRQLYYLLAAYDPDFPRLFKVQADFDDSVQRNGDSDLAFAQLVASIVERHQLRHVDASGIARLIEQAARLADDREKVSIEIGRIADIVREADYWAGEAKASTITAAHITRAIDEDIDRASRIRERAQETIGRQIVLIDTEGSKVGQINGLSVMQVGSLAFGRPSRITARVRMGAGRVVDIEREVNLGGPLHSKGVMILWGFLAGRYAQHVPLALAASLVFEQSYGGVDGDSASSTELYALLSALSGIPIDQGLAVTGSVNQWGEVQAIGGVNEKIEGYFDICRERGLTGRQGVLIPRSNVQHLMLREDVVAAARNGQFHIHAVATIDEGIEILTGIKAGIRGSDGSYPPGTVNRRVEERLVWFAEQARRFGKSVPGIGSDKEADKATS